jgi:uncharacterized membrane protein (DUF2068 family)
VHNFGMRSEMSDDRWIRLIAILKLVKAGLLIATGFGVLKLLHHDVAGVVEHWINLLQLDPDNQHIQHLLTKVWFIDDRVLKEIGAGSFSYAALFLTEGIGLLLRKRWAQYFTVIVTASFLPLEFYELIREPSLLKTIVTISNVAILIYLVIRLRKK